MKKHNINTWAMDAIGWSRDALPAACTIIKENSTKDLKASTPMTMEERIARKKAHISAMEYRAARLDETRKAAKPCNDCGVEYVYRNNCATGLCWVCTVTERRGYMANYTKSACIHPVCWDKRDGGSLFCQFHRRHNRESKINEPCASCGVAERVITESYRVDSYCVDCGPMVRKQIVYKKEEHLKFNKDWKK